MEGYEGVESRVMQAVKVCSHLDRWIPVDTPPRPHELIGQDLAAIGDLVRRARDGLKLDGYDEGLARAYSAWRRACDKAKSETESRLVVLLGVPRTFRQALEEGIGDPKELAQWWALLKAWLEATWGISNPPVVQPGSGRAGRLAHLKACEEIAKSRGS